MSDISVNMHIKVVIKVPALFVNICFLKPPVVMKSYRQYVVVLMYTGVRDKSKILKIHSTPHNSPI